MRRFFLNNSIFLTELTLNPKDCCFFLFQILSLEKDLSEYPKKAFNFIVYRFQPEELFYKLPIVYIDLKDGYRLQILWLFFEIDTWL